MASSADTASEDGSYYPHVPLFAGKRVYTPEGVKGDANRAVTQALDAAGKLLASGRITHKVIPIPGVPRRRRLQRAAMVHRHGQSRS